MAEEYPDVTIYDGNEGMFYIVGELEGNESIFSNFYPMDDKNGTTFLYNPNYTIEMEFSDSKKKYLFYVDGIALTIVSLFGVIGTILSMIVLLKPGIHDLFSSFLTALSMFDTIFLILAIFYLGLPELFGW